MFKIYNFKIYECGKAKSRNCGAYLWFVHLLTVDLSATMKYSSGYEEQKEQKPYQSLLIQENVSYYRLLV